MMMALCLRHHRRQDLHHLCISRHPPRLPHAAPIMMARCLRHHRRQVLHRLCISRHLPRLPHAAPTILPMTTINQRPVQHLTCTHFRTHTNIEPRRPPPLHQLSTRLPVLKTLLHLTQMGSASPTCARLPCHRHARPAPRQLPWTAQQQLDERQFYTELPTTGTTNVLTTIRSPKPIVQALWVWWEFPTSVVVRAPNPPSTRTWAKITQRGGP
jgi:hypothetical protein